MSPDDLDPTPTGGPPMFDDDLVDEFDDIDEEEDEADGAVRYLSVEEFLAGSSEPEVPEGFRSGFVSLVGRPNVGKSTLLNRLVGSKVSIVSPKVQTTRRRVIGITIQDGCQVMFVDTPGIFAPSRRLETAMVRAAATGIADADLVLLLLDVRKGIDANARLVAFAQPVMEHLHRLIARSSSMVLPKLGL